MRKKAAPEVDQYEDDEYDDDIEAIPPPRKLYRGRAGIIALSAVLAELAVIGGVGNQFVAEPVAKRLSERAGTAADYEIGGLQSLLTYSWRFAPGSGQTTKQWASSFAAIGTLFVLTLFLGWVVSRGSVTFSRVWVSIAAIVAALTPVAVMVRNLVIIPSAPGPRLSRVGQSVYGPAPDGAVVSFYGPAIVFGLGLGVIVGLIAAIIAVLSRRRVVLPAAAPAPVAAPLNAYGEPTPGYAPPPWQPEPDYREALAVYGQPVRPSQDEQRTTALPAGTPTEMLPKTEDTEQIPAVPRHAQNVPGQQAPGVPTAAEEAALAEPVTAELNEQIHTAAIPAVQAESARDEPAARPADAWNSAVAPPVAREPEPTPAPEPEPAPTPTPEPEPVPSPPAAEPAGSSTEVLPPVRVSEQMEHTQEFDLGEVPPPSGNQPR